MRGVNLGLQGAHSTTLHSSEGGAKRVLMHCDVKCCDNGLRADRTPSKSERTSVILRPGTVLADSSGSHQQCHVYLGAVGGLLPFVTQCLQSGA